MNSRCEGPLTHAGTLPLPAAAVAYANLGWPVFPCEPDGKRPVGSLVPHGFKDATTDLATVYQWWTSEPEANIATPTGSVSDHDVLDIDVRRDGDGYPGLKRLARHRYDSMTSATTGRLSPIEYPFAEAETRNGGRHYFYPASGSNCRAFAAHHIDVKANGGYVLLAPSTVPPDPGIDGPGRYRWLDTNNGLTKALDVDTIAVLLAPPVRRLTLVESTGGTVEHLVAWVERQSEGNRNRGLFWAALKAAKDGNLDHTATAALVAAGVAIGLPEKEATATVKSAGKQVTV